MNNQINGTPEKLLRARDIANRLNISKSLAYQLRKPDKFPLSE